MDCQCLALGQGDVAQMLWLMHVIAFAAVLHSLMCVIAFLLTRPPYQPPPGAVQGAA
jgi:hypothetical protein